MNIAKLMLINFVLVILFVSGCSSKTDANNWTNDIKLDVIETKYDSISVKITNTSNLYIGYSEYYEIECFQNGSWNEVSPLTSWHDLLYVVEPNSSQLHDFPLSKEFSSGKYRISILLNDSNQTDSMQYKISAIFKVK